MNNNYSLKKKQKLVERELGIKKKTPSLAPFQVRVSLSYSVAEERPRRHFNSLRLSWKLAGSSTGPWRPSHSGAEGCRVENSRVGTESPINCVLSAWPEQSARRVARLQGAIALHCLRQEDRLESSAVSTARTEADCPSPSQQRRGKPGGHCGSPVPCYMPVLPEQT